MKKILAVAVASIGVSGLANAGTFVNGGFEDGNLNGWTGGGGTWYGVPIAPVPASAYNGGTPNNTVVGVGTDSITGLSTVYNGSYAVRLNDAVNNYSVSTLRQTVNNYSNNDIYFEWQAVLQSSHNLTNSDYFSLTLRDLTKNTNLVERTYSSAGSIGAGTSNATWHTTGLYNNWYTAGWVVEHVDLAALGAVGDDLELTVLASDCPYGGHAGYVYLDGFAPVVVPEPASLALAGLGLAALAAVRRRKSA